MLEITEDVITQIMYAMENQTVNSYLDVLKMTVIDENSETIGDLEENRYWEIPPWKPSDGFLLMKQFAEQLKNAQLQTELLSILDSRYKVFKRFKETVKSDSMLEKRWYDFKDKNMRKIILDWFSIYTQATEMQKIQWEETETEDLLLSDIVIKQAYGHQIELAKAWENKAIQEIFKEYNSEQRDILRKRLQIENKNMNASTILMALSPKDEPLSFIKLTPWIEKDKENIFWVQMIYTAPQYRGLGLAKLLIHHIKDKRIAATIPSSAQYLIKVLQNEGFSSIFTTLLV